MTEVKVYGYTYFDGETTRNVYALDWDMTTVNVYSHYWGKHCTVLKGVKYFLDDKKVPYSYWESSFAIPSEVKRSSSNVKATIPSSPQAGDIVYTTNVDNPKTGDIRELLIFGWERSWEQFYEVYNGLWWVRYEFERPAKAAAKRFKENGGDNG